MKFSRQPIHMPDTPGPFGVDSTSKSWYVVNSRTLRGTRIGRIGGKGINYFDRAIAEADRRNRNEQA